MERGQSRIRHRARVHAAGWRDLHHIHLPGGKWMGVRAWRPRLLHHRLRRRGVHHVLLAAARHLDTSHRVEGALANGILHAGLREPGLGHGGGRGEHRRAHALSGAAAQRPRHHRVGILIRGNQRQRRHLDRHHRHRDLRRALRRERLGHDRHPERRHGARLRRWTRHRVAVPTTRWNRPDVCAPCGRTSRIPYAPSPWHVTQLVRQHRAAHRTGVLHVAAHLRVGVYRAGRLGVSAQCGAHAPVSVGVALRVLHRVRGTPVGAGAHRNRRGSRIAAGDT